MKRFKICIIFLFIVLLSGCSGVYDITINEDLSVTESVNITLEKQEETYERVMILLESYGISTDDYTVSDLESTVKVSYTKNFDSIEDYILNSKLYPELFGNIDYTYDDRKLSINTSGVFSTNNDSSYVVNNFNTELLKININTPLTITSSNADEQTSDYSSWVIRQGDNSKEISITIDADKVGNRYKSVIVLIVMGLIIGVFGVLAFLKFRKSNKI